jgi:aminoglycoside 6'-N-acetyltransferase
VDDHARTGRIAFRPLAEANFPDMVRWLSDPGVARWWPEADLGLEAIARKYTPVISGAEPVRGFVIAIDGAPVGFIQAYVLGDHPGYQRQLGVDPGAVATDLFIGEPGWRDRGWGTAVLGAFLERIVFGEMAAGLAVIAPEPGNARAIRVYARIGFRWEKTVAVVDEDDPAESGDEYVMLLPRRTWEGTTGAMAQDPATPPDRS